MRGLTLRCGCRMITPCADADQPCLRLRHLIPLATLHHETHQSPLTASEKAILVAAMRAEGYFDDDDFPGVLGNKNSFFIAHPIRRRKSASRKRAKVTA
jgi:hypothetical protein